MALGLAIGVISRWRSTSDNKYSFVFSGERDQIDQYLDAVDQIQCSIVSGTAYDENGAKSAIQMAMLRLANEMDNLLKLNAAAARSTDNNNIPDSSTYSSTMTDSGSNSYVDDYEYGGSVLSEVIIDDLRSIAQRMNGAGYLGDCKKAFISNRKRCIEASYQRLHIQKFSSDDAPRMQWNMLEPIIKVWMKSAKICFRKIFSYEKQLCGKIFGDDDDDDCFLEISGDRASELLEIATNLSGIKTASERLFGILELYKTCSDLLPEMNKLFDTQSSESFRTKAEQVVAKLAGTACMTIEKFEKDLLTACMTSIDKSHSLCKYVMDYVFKLEQNKQTLMELSLSNPPGNGVNFTITEPQPQNKLPFHVMWIIMCLVSKLECQAQLYKNDSTMNFHLMNNFFYIVKKINGEPEVREMIGDDCFEDVSSKFDQVKAKYLRLTLARVLSILQDKMPLKKRLRKFNAEFNKVQSDLEKCKVPDFQLLKDIRISMEEMLVPPYSSLLELLSKSSCLTADHVKFSVEELKSAIQGFFPST
ncbi:hypothetical protein SSX86_013473 [Deinandra increscens subsp. villosa]|uniref:Exocyst subunit Exo70 family protein n=1 Tax=Deinandra increscens subsp. villosa TaxID=3103831 RepID=A0AAP0D5C3_9ASTR